MQGTGIWRSKRRFGMPNDPTCHLCGGKNCSPPRNLSGRKRSPRPCRWAGSIVLQRQVQRQDADRVRSATVTVPSIELAHKEQSLRLLVVVAHMRLSRILLPKHFIQQCGTLTSREIEVLKWIADGKTIGEISDLLAVSENNVKFHIRNVIANFHVTNKTAAAVYAAAAALHCWL